MLITHQELRLYLPMICYRKARWTCPLGVAVGQSSLFNNSDIDNLFPSMCKHECRKKTLDRGRSKQCFKLRVGSRHVAELNWVDCSSLGKSSGRPSLQIKTGSSSAIKCKPAFNHSCDVLFGFSSINITDTFEIFLPLYIVFFQE